MPQNMRKWDKIKLLMHFWRLPSCILSDIGECQCEEKDKTKLQRHFILKIVPRQLHDETVKDTVNYIMDLCKQMKIENKVEVECISASRSWSEDISSPTYEAAKIATMQV